VISFGSLNALISSIVGMSAGSTIVAPAS